MDKSSPHTTGKDILITSLLLGLVTGFIEALLLYTLNVYQLLSGNIIFLGSGPQVFWLSPLACLFVFGGLVAIIYPIARYKLHLPVYQILLFLLFWLMVFDWIFIPLSGRVSVYAVGLLGAGVAFQTVRVVLKRPIAFKRLTRQVIPWVIGLLLVTFIIIQAGRRLSEELVIDRLPRMSKDVPNILVIVIDALRADHLSSYGYIRQTSPFIDQIAEQGVVFENAIAPSSWTQPVHASLLTGRYPHEHGADNSRLDGKYPTVAEELQNLGYRTGAFSANYEVFNVIDGFGRGFIHFEDHYQSIKNLAVNSFYGHFIEFYILHRLFHMPYRFDRRLAEDINQSALRWIDRRPERPFFVMINYYDVHAPYIPPQPYRSVFSEKPEPGGKISTDWGMDQIYTGLTPEEIQDEIDAYDGAIVYVDDQIRKLISGLEQRGLLDNTAIIILSDHGESFGEHNLLEHHNSLYREIIRVPLIIRLPGSTSGGRRIETPVSLVSLPATLMEIGQGKDDGLFPHPSLLSLVNNPSEVKEWSIPLSESVQVWWVPPQHLSYHGAMKSLFVPEIHYIAHERFGEELYLSDDPMGLINLAGSPEYESYLDEFRQYLKNLLRSQDIWGE